MEAEGDVHIPDLTGSSSYQDIAAEEDQQEFYTDWAQLLQSKVDNRLSECESCRAELKFSNIKTILRSYEALGRSHKWPEIDKFASFCSVSDPHCFQGGSGSSVFHLIADPDPDPDPGREPNKWVSMRIRI